MSRLFRFGFVVVFLENTYVYFGHAVIPFNNFDCGFDARPIAARIKHNIYFLLTQAEAAVGDPEIN